MVGHKPSSKPSWQKKPPLTHFLCLPLVNEASQPQLDRSLKQFRDEVCWKTPENPTAWSTDGSNAVVPSAEPISPKAIRPLGTLHLTLGVMTLNQDQLAKAIELLSSVDVAALLKPRSAPPSERGTISTQEAAVPSLRVDLKGLQSMHEPNSTSILYAAPLDHTDRLYDFSRALQRNFQEFLVPDDRPLKLHATVVNTIYAKCKNPTSRSQGHGPKERGLLKMDAIAILHKYEDFIWAENLKLDRIAICEMGAKKIMDAAKVRVLDERYTEVACASLPT